MTKNPTPPRYDGWVTEMSNDPVKVKDLTAARGIDNLLYSADTYFRCGFGGRGRVHHWGFGGLRLTVCGVGGGGEVGCVQDGWGALGRGVGVSGEGLGT